MNLMLKLALSATTILHAVEFDTLKQLVATLARAWTTPIHALASVATCLNPGRVQNIVAAAANICEWRIDP
jgi:vancomycin resistance protein YoaR